MCLPLRAESDWRASHFRSNGSRSCRLAKRKAPAWIWNDSNNSVPVRLPLSTARLSANCFAGGTWRFSSKSLPLQRRSYSGELFFGLERLLEHFYGTNFQSSSPRIALKRWTFLFEEIDYRRLTKFCFEPENTKQFWPKRDSLIVLKGRRLLKTENLRKLSIALIQMAIGWHPSDCAQRWVMVALPTAVLWWHCHSTLTIKAYWVHTLCSTWWNGAIPRTTYIRSSCIWLIKCTLFDSCAAFGKGALHLLTGIRSPPFGEWADSRWQSISYQ